MKKKPTQERSRQMVAKIIQAAGRIIGNEGLDALTTNRVAELAGVSEGSLYQYFYDRADLLETLLENVSADVTVAMKNSFPVHPSNHQHDLRKAALQSLKIAIAVMKSDPLYPELARNIHRIPAQRLINPVEQFLLSSGRAFIQSRHQEIQEKELRTKLFVLINSCLFTIIRFISQDDPFLKEDSIVECLADMISDTLLHKKNH